MGTRFRALAAPIDTSTGDERRFSPNITVAKLPLPLRWPREDVGAHDGAVTIGRIDSVDMADDEIWVEGELFDDVDPAVTPRLAEDVAHAMTLAREGVLGISVDLDDYEAVLVRKGSDDPMSEEDMMDPNMRAEMLITKGRIRACTLVDIPAFAETNHTFELFADENDEAVSEPEDEIDEDDPELALTAAVSGATDLPVAEREHAWDGPAAASRVFDAYSGADGNVDKTKAGRAFLWVDGDGTKRGDYKLGFADLLGGELTIVPRGVAATAGGRGVDSAEGVDKEAVKSRICSLYETVRKAYDDWPACPFDSSGTESEDVEALTASLGAVYPAHAFTVPEVKGLTAITYDYERGVAYGHIAPWGVCHEGISGVCVLAPKAQDYRDFHVRRVQTDEGVVYAGRLTAGGEHAPTTDDVTAHHVRQHHDVMTTVAYVRAHEDEWGIFVCGPIVAGLDAETMGILSRRKVSADWRETEVGLSMIEVLALRPGPREVSEPGFPVLAAFARGRQIALVASLVPEPALEVTVMTGFPPTLATGQTFTLDMGEAFKAAYRTIKAEEAADTERMVEVQRVRGELAEAMRADAARVRAELEQTIGV